MTDPIDRLEDLTHGRCDDQTVEISIRLAYEVIETFRALTDRVEFALAFVPEEVLRPDASAIDTAVAVLRRAADELDELPAALRRPPALFGFVPVPPLSSSSLRAEADHVMERLAEIRFADSRPALQP